MTIRFIEKLDIGSFISAASKVPYQKLSADLFPSVEVWVRRDDLLDPILSGNKAYKLLFSLIKAKSRGLKTIVTCGGAWSNHIHATAAAGARFGFKTVGIIRGEDPGSLSATLSDARRLGMELSFVSRAKYKQERIDGLIGDRWQRKGEVLFIPEGGAGLAGIEGGRLLGQIIEESAPVVFDQVWVACGTGTTFVGLAAGLSNMSVVGVEVLKAGDSIAADALSWQKQISRDLSDTLVRVGGHSTSSHRLLGSTGWQLLSGHHCGGYGKYPASLQKFQYQFEKETGVPLDPVYMSKLFLALSGCSKGGQLDGRHRVLVIHSGGLQGRRGRA
ncbi:1-aminocyclopropane-1-carboxylate deaminase/D-cysteine desulfhydrase [Microbulbifer sp. JTAC008]|uniref:1-aminocyclopropane-1-carboxylate deaminase/D-cysteine desulfhydrase n=1 Tax=unclassified Microbulbifer TaxID=2619833 RepID=UPI00403A6136